MVDPPGEAREDAWQVIQCRQTHGHGSSLSLARQQLDTSDVREYRSFGLGHGKDLASYTELTRTRGMLWPVVNGKETPYRYTAGYDQYVKKAVGAHFYKAWLREKAAFWIRPYHPPAEGAGPDLSLLAHERAACSSIGTADR